MPSTAIITPNVALSSIASLVAANKNCDTEALADFLDSLRCVWSFSVSLNRETRRWVVALGFLIRDAFVYSSQINLMCVYILLEKNNETSRWSPFIRILSSTFIWQHGYLHESLWGWWCGSGGSGDGYFLTVERHSSKAFFNNDILESTRTEWAAGIDLERCVFLIDYYQCEEIHRWLAGCILADFTKKKVKAIEKQYNGIVPFMIEVWIGNTMQPRCVCV